MPIDYRKYPHNWKDIRVVVLRRAKDRCELCDAQNGRPHWKTGSKVVLTVAHLDQDVKNNKLWNLRALCQRCHLIIDLPWKMRKRQKKPKGQMEWTEKQFKQ